ncbi:MAG: ribulose-phosphate 3-epimerase [bacterium]|nr:ribulose-phosphate 3-epimerase [bacterium]
MSQTRQTPVEAGAIFEPYALKNGRGPALVITPSVLSSDFAHSARELAKCRRARARWVHIDVMDGHFVPNLTFGPPVLRKWTAAEPELFYDTHLMIENPLKFAEDFVRAGSSLLNIHIEATARPRRDLRAIKRLGVRAGVTLKPKTPVREILDVLDEVDLVLVMSVEPGFGNQELIAKTLNKVRELNLIRRERGLGFRLEIDGGINPETVALAAAAGADVMVAGSAVFRGGDVAGNMKTLRGVLSKAGYQTK